MPLQGPRHFRPPAISGGAGLDWVCYTSVERLIEAAKKNRSGHRDATAILVAYRHGLTSELAALRWDDGDLATERIL